MNVFQVYLDNHNITRYQIAKITGVGQSTLQRVSDSKGGTNSISGRILKATAKTLDKTPGQVLDELISLEKTITNQQVD